MSSATVLKDDRERPWPTINNNYRYLIAPESFQRLRVFMVEQGFYPYGDEECVAIVLTRKQSTKWYAVRIETKKKVSEGKPK